MFALLILFIRIGFIFAVWEKCETKIHYTMSYENKKEYWYKDSSLIVFVEAMFL